MSVVPSGCDSSIHTKTSRGMWMREDTPLLWARDGWGEQWEMSPTGFLPRGSKLELNLRAVFVFACSFVFLTNNIQPVIDSHWKPCGLRQSQRAQSISQTFTWCLLSTSAIEDIRGKKFFLNVQGPGFNLLLVQLRVNHGLNNSFESLGRLIKTKFDHLKEALGVWQSRGGEWPSV